MAAQRTSQVTSTSSNSQPAFFLFDSLGDVNATATVDGVITIKHEQQSTTTGGNNNETQQNGDTIPSDYPTIISTSPAHYELNDDTNDSTTITIRSSIEQVRQWLINNQFSSLETLFHYFNGLDLLHLIIDDMHRLCGDTEGSRLYHSLKETIVPPLKTLYIQIINTDFYSPIYLHTYARDELKQKLMELVHQQESSVNIFIKLGESKIKVDSDDIIKYSLSNGGRYLLNTLPFELVLYFIASG